MQKQRTLFSGLAFTLALLSVSVFVPEADARLETVQLRQTRQQKASERWSSPERVTLNVHYRVPVIEALGYLAAFYPDNAKLTTVAQRLRPVAEQVNSLAGESFQGRSFPPEVQTQCNTLRAELFKTIDEVYGKEATARVQTYIDNKYKSLRGGLFSAIE